MKDVPYSKYGVTKGWCALNEAGRHLLMVVADEWPSWGLTAVSAGLDLVVLILLNPSWKAWCEKFLTTTKVYL